jgi:hypothetical protein
VNRRDRRRRAKAARDPRSGRRMREMQHRVERTGQPAVIDGLTAACRDCTATGGFVLLPGRRVLGQVWHEPGCPAASGITPWSPVPLDTGTAP